MLGLIAAAGRTALSTFSKGGKYLKNQTAQGLGNVKKKTINARSFLKKDINNEKNTKESSAITLRPSTKLSTKVISPSSFLGKDLDKKDITTDKESKKDFDEILQELSAIKKSLTTINESLNSNLENRKKQLKSENLKKKKRSFREKESELEKKKKGGGPGVSLPGAPKLGLFDTILNYLTNVFLGSLAVFALSKLPQIIDAFNSIGKNLSNTFNQVKFAISSLLTNFPKQIKAVGSLFKKIITSKPAQAIGKLLAQAGKAVANVFAKAGKAIFNIIKQPLKSLLGKGASKALGGAAKGIGSVARRGIGRVIPRAAAKIGGKNAAAVATKLGLLTGKGFKHFSKIGSIFKRIPFIGALIGIGIDLALGVPPDSAVAGAVGSTIGAAIGGAIGTGVIPIPGVGTFLGGLIGAAVGDWAGKEIYKNLKGNFASILPGQTNDDVQKKAEGGEVTQTTRETAVEKRRIRKIVIDKPIRRPGNSQQLSKSTIDTAKESLMKGDKSLGRFKRLSKTYSDMRFVGTLLKLGIDIGLGEKPSQTNINVAADSLAYSIGMAIKNESLELPGVDRNTSGTIANTLSNWARKEIYKEIMNKRGELALRESEKVEDILPNDQIFPGTDGVGGQWGPLLDLIASKESGGNYEAMYPSTTLPGATSMTIAEDARRATGAVGKYQQLPQYLVNRARAAGLNPDKDLYSPENQDLIAAKVNIGMNRGGNDWLRGKITDEQFMQRLSMEFAALPNARGQFYYPGQRSSIRPEQVKSALFKIKSGNIVGVNQSGLPPLPRTDTLPGGVQRYGASRDGGSRKHAGVDFDISGDEKFYSRIGGVVVGSPFRYGADGWAIDIFNKQLGVYERIAEANKILVKPGQAVTPGQAVVQGESRTGVIHYEIRRKIEGGFENSLNPLNFLKGSRFLGGFIPKDGKYFLHKGEYVIDKDSVDTFGMDFIAKINQTESKTQLHKVANNLIEELKDYTDDDSETVIYYPILPKESPQVMAGGSSGVQFIPIGSGVNNRITYDTVLHSALYKNG